MHSSQRNPFLDIIKAFCILFVIITHDAISGTFRLKALFPFWITMAVPMFMIISGSVYAISFERNGICEITQAYTRRFIVPKYIRYTVPFLMAFVVEFLNEVRKSKAFGSAGHWIFLFFQGGSGPGSYYYPIMLQFVLFYPVLHFIIKKYSFKGLVFCFFLNACFEFFQRVLGCNEGFYRMLLFRYTFVISFGSYLWQCKEKNIGRRWKVGSFLAGVAFIIAYWYVKLPPKIIIYWTETCFLACLYLVPIADFLIRRVRLGCKPLELLGKASFNIFLVQMVYFKYGVGFVRRIIPTHSAQLALHIGMCVLVGLLFYEVEQPVTKRLLKCWKEMNQRNANG